MIKEEAFDKGGLLHDMLQSHYGLLAEYYKTHNTIGPPAYNKVIEQSTSIGEKSLMSRDLSTDDGLRVIESYQEYADYRRGETWIPLFVEQTATKEIYKDDNVRILWAGIIDLIYKTDWDSDTISITDHKSESRASDPIASTNQFRGYAWMFDVRNIVVNKIGFQKSLKPSEKFRRYTMHYPKPIIDEWRINTIKSALSLYNDLQNLEEMQNKRRINSCLGKYGKPCGLLGICETEPALREWKIQSNYIVGEPWDITKRLRTWERL
jgi:hypothetical protein